MADFVGDREELFREFLSLKNGLPSHDTVSRQFRLVDPETLSSGAFWRCWVRTALALVATDGSAHRSYEATDA